MCVCLYICVSVGICVPYVEIRGQFGGDISLLPSFGTWGINSGHQDRQQAPLSTESSRKSQEENSVRKEDSEEQML